MDMNRFIAAARAGKNELWRYLLTLLMTVILVLSGGVCLTLPVVALARGSIDLAAYLPGWAYLALNLLPFIFIPLGLWIGLRVLHKRPLISLVNPMLRFNWRRFWFGAALWLALNVVYNLVFAVIFPGYYTWSFNPAAFWPFLLVLVLLIPIQSSAEELAFRGYLTQGLGLLRWWLGWIVPSLLFGLLHIANPEISAYGLLTTLPVYIGMGLLLGWVTLRSGSLEMALGIHIFNNLYTSLLVTFPSSALETQALFSIQNYNAWAEMIAFFVVSAVFVLIFERVLRSKDGGWALPRQAGPLLAIGVVAGLLLGLSACSASPETPAPDGPKILLSDCELSVNGASAQCGKLAVPENRDKPEGRQIELNVVVVKAVSRNPAPDPLFLLAGGPGEAATQSFAGLIGSLERVRAKRDLVLVDQRGTGKSGGLACLPDSTATPNPLLTPTAYGEEVSHADQIAEIEDCVDTMTAAEVDLTQYTTEIAMHDLDDVRAALGYQQINLLGVSYGTRAALTYTRLYPFNVRSLILDGIVPPGWVLGGAMRADAQQSLDLAFERCQTDPACSQAFPDFENDFYDVLAHLQGQSEIIETVHPTTGQKMRVAITPLTLTVTTRMMTYNDNMLSLLPLMIHAAYQGDYSLLASQYLLTTGSLGESISVGMYYSVWCYEDLPKLPEEGELGSYYFDPDMSLSRDVCNLWPTPGPTATPGLIEQTAPAGDANPVETQPPSGGVLPTTEGSASATPTPGEDYPGPDTETRSPGEDYPAPDVENPTPEDYPGPVTETPQGSSSANNLALVRFGRAQNVASETPTPAASQDEPTPALSATPGIDYERWFPRTDMPVLLISGEADPVTPPSNGDQVAKIFTNSLHLVLPGMGHANFYYGCLPTVIRNFLEVDRVVDLDTDCVQNIHPAPFFLSPVGPHP